MSESSDSTPLDGKPPKDPSLMRGVLKHVHAANLENKPGERLGGLDKTDQLHLTSFYNAGVAKEFQRALSAAGIPSRMTREGEMVRMEVDMEDRDRAHAELVEFRKSHTDIRDNFRNRRFDFALLGAIGGLTVGLALSMGLFTSLLDIARVFLVALIGSLGGHLCDRMRLGTATGLLRFGVYEFMILAVIPGLVIVLYRITPALVLR